MFTCHCPTSLSPAAVRQNLLSLQGTADLLATTQSRLATGKKVNSALDNPTNFFTAAGLDSRASDISNLLDSIGNGVQVLQAANTGITSLSKLVDTAKSIANQVLQQPSGYTSKANVAIAAPTGAGPLAVAGTAADLTNAGTNSLQGKTLIFKTATATTTLTISNVAGAGNVNSIDSLNTALAAAGVESAAQASTPTARWPSPRPTMPLRQTITATGTYAAPPAGSSTSVDVSGTATFGCRHGGGRRCGVAGHARQSGQPVQPDHYADHHHRAGCFLQRHQPAERRLAQAGVQRNRQVDARRSRA